MLPKVFYFRRLNLGPVICIILFGRDRVACEVKGYMDTVFVCMSICRVLA